MACLETKPQMYSQWCSNKTLKDKFKIDDVEYQKDKKMSPNVAPVRRINLESENKVLSLKNLFEQDPQAADLRWSLFVAACNTYRHDTCLRPFPPMYIQNECKNIEELREVIESIPSLGAIYERLNDPDVYENHKAAIDLLHWVLITLKDPHLKSVNKEDHESILAKVPSEILMSRPNLIFQVANPHPSSKEERWRSIMKGHSTFFAYHGSRLENFHSIIHHGIQQHMSNPGLYGTGIYLSSELSVSVTFSPVGYGWGGSFLGSELSCIALCEVVDHSDVKRADNTGGNAHKAIEVAFRGKIANKYYLSTNSDLVKVRYLLVYNQDFSPSKKSKTTGLLSWFKKNKFLTFVVGYVVLLVSVGLTQNKNVEKYYKFLIQKAGLD